MKRPINQLTRMRDAAELARLIEQETSNPPTMNIFEKVSKGLEYHLKELTVGKTCYECPYYGDNPCEIQLIANTIALLKEQEPREVFEDENETPL